MAPTSFSSNAWTRAAAAAIGVVVAASPAYAQLDPLLFLKRSAPNVLVLLDTGNRMQLDAPSDPANPATTSNYYDPFIYARNTNLTAETTLGVTATNTIAQYRRLYRNFALSSTSNPKATTSHISVLTDRNLSPDNTPGTFATFDAPTRLAIARAAIYQAIRQNQTVARFGLYKMRQNSPTVATQGNLSPITSADPSQSVNGTTEVSNGRWATSHTQVGGNTQDGAVAAGNGGAIVVAPDAANANTTVMNVLSVDVRGGWKGAGAAPSPLPAPLLPAGLDDATTVDEPVKNLLDDARTDIVRLINADISQNQCRNTVAILVTGGGEGNTVSGADPTATAANYVSGLSGRHVPIYVVAIAPPSADVPQLQNIASKSGGQYFEITKAQIDAAMTSAMWSAASTGAPTGTVVVPEAARAINVGIQAAFETFEDLNTAALSPWPPSGVPSIIPTSEFQVSAPIIGTVNLSSAVDAKGNPLTPDPATVLDRASNVIPQRSNIMVTSAFTLPGFDGTLRAFRVYKPVADSTQPSGWKFVADGTPLWTGHAPASDSRNLFTTLADGTMVAFSVANVAQLAPLMNLNATDATNVINVVRSLPVGTVLDSTPAIMNPPSLDPPPDDSYPAFASANKDRRSLVFVGTNRGVLEALDGRTGLEVWGYIPMNLLPKLRTLWDGQAVGTVDFLMDGSPKIADIKFADASWHTMMFIGQGAGGTFYQAIDVTLSLMASTLRPTDDSTSDLLSFFSTPTLMPVKWSFPALADWDPTITNTSNATDAANPYLMHYGDVRSGAATISKTLGQTWSDPAIGQVVSNVSPYVMVTGSGFLPYSTQQQANRGGVVAGSTFYMLKAEDGTLLDSKSVGSDGKLETLDNCVAINNCTTFKNALQSDPVATGPSDSRFITKAYIGDLDGRIWRFDITLNASNQPIFATGGGNPVTLYTDRSSQPIFSSMATVNVSGSQQYVFAATGNDLLPSNGVSQQYKLVGILDSGSTGTQTFEIDLAKVDNTAGDEKVTAFPAVAGDIVFFTTTTFNPASPCTLPTASLYALTFIGGPAYDTNNDGRFDNRDSVLVKSVAGVRATAPFIVDQHLAFGTGKQVQLFGDPSDFNNGVGQAGVRILSWREVR